MRVSMKRVGQIETCGTLLTIECGILPVYAGVETRSNYVSSTNQPIIVSFAPYESCMTAFRFLAANRKPVANF